MKDAAIEQAWHELKDYIEQLEWSRDDAVHRLEGALGDIDLLEERLRDLDGSVERLRAAQQLPDVGPVTPVENAGFVFGQTADYCLRPKTAQVARVRAAQWLAVAAFLDTEADDTISDDDEVTEASVISDALYDHLGFAAGAVADDIVRALDALRARGGQEAGQ